MSLKQKELTILMLINKDPITIKKLSQEINLSERNLRYSLENLEYYLNQFFLESKLIRAQKEIFTELEEKEIESFLKYVYNGHYIYTSSERQEYILNFFLFEDQPTLKILEKVLDVSRTTLKKDMQGLKSELEGYSLYFKYDVTRIYIGGNEKKIRHLMMLKMIDSLEKPEEKYTKPIRKMVKKLILAQQNEIDNRNIEEIINRIEGEFMYGFSIEFNRIISHYLWVTLFRISKKHYIVKKHNAEFLKKTFQYKVVKNNLEKIIPKRLIFEFIHLTEYFLSSSLNGKYNDELLNIQLFTFYLLKEMKKKVNYSLLKEELFQKICSYLTSAFYRMKNNFVLGAVNKGRLEGSKIIFILTEISKNDKYLNEKLRDEEIYFIGELIKKEIEDQEKKVIKLSKLIEISKKHSTDFNERLFIKEILKVYGENILDDTEKELLITSPFKKLIEADKGIKLL
ncbi:MAG: helix-turn-helix domain-containing protein [Psychrilyobacter sp.]|uniref:helix-turn-helix domain-containing protein n=1 Tax=Psychrilyobacter sp. TaxID=2586924 RepID=UPI003C7849CC